MGMSETSKRITYFWLSSLMNALGGGNGYGNSRNLKKNNILLIEFFDGRIYLELFYNIRVTESKEHIKVTIPALKRDTIWFCLSLNLLKIKTKSHHFFKVNKPFIDDNQLAFNTIVSSLKSSPVYFFINRRKKF